MFVEEVMQLLELVPLREALVGLPRVNRLSTEKRKKLTIAVELVANPSIIFMDEPTSGLDARAAAIVMRTVRNTVDKGRTEVCTIYQPSIDIFDAFDELFLLKIGGGEIYVGPLRRHSSHLIKYFEAMIGIPYIFVQTIVYGIIVYAMIGFEWMAVKFFWYLFFMYFTFLYLTFYGMMIVAVTPDHNFAAIISSAFYAIWNLFSGFIVPRTISCSFHTILFINI